MTPPPSATKHPLVSIIVRTHGQRGSLLRECLQSVVNQEYRPLEVNIVEDGGSRSTSVVSEFDNLPGIVMNYHSLPPSGRCVAGNTGLAAATGRWINFLDDDDQLLPGHVRLLVERFRNKPHLKGVYGISLQIPTDVHSLEPLSYSESSPRRLPTEPFTRWKLWHEAPFPIQACLFDRALFVRHGGLDPVLDQLEDWHLWMRYFSSEPIDVVEEVTSVFRIPADPAQLDRRQQSFQHYRPVIAEKQRDITVTLSRTEFLQIATMELRNNLSPEIIAVADHLPGAGRPIRSLLTMIRVARSSWRNLRMLVQRIDPGIRRHLRELSSAKPDDTFTMSVADVLSLMPELQSRHDLADFRILENVLRRLGWLKTPKLPLEC